MRYLKKFEEKNKEVTLYSCSEFRITINSNDSLSYESVWISTSAIIMMAALIFRKSTYLDDTKLINIKLRSKDKKDALDRMNFEDNRILGNLIQYHSAIIEKFTDGEKFKSLPDDVYKELILEYYPLLKKAVLKSNTMGDIIDNFTEIYHKIENEDLELRKTSNKYNL